VVIVCILGACGTSGPRPTTAVASTSTASNAVSATRSPATTERPARMCGTVPGIRDEGPLPVRVTRGDIACPRAITLANRYFRQSETTQGHPNSYIEVDGFVCDSEPARSPIPGQPYYECLAPPLSADPIDIVTIGPRAG
jgi:hypothetical protein